MDLPAREIIRKIRLKTRRRLNTLFVGEYHSAFRGYGLLFDTVREYQYGDDVRSIDWNVSARMNHLYMKQYVEERELSVVLAVDLSASLLYGTGRSKRDALMETASLLLYLAQVNNDRVSVLLFTDRVEKYLPPRKGKTFINSSLDAMLNHRPSGVATDISAAVDFLRRVLKKRSVVFVLSDFLDRDFLPKLKLLGKKHDVIPVIVTDPRERETDLFGLAEYVDLETGEEVITESFPGPTLYPLNNDTNAIRISTEGPTAVPLLKFFERRNRSRHHGSPGDGW